MAFLPISGGLVLASNLSTIVLMPRFGPRPLVAFGLLAAAGGAVWLAQLGPHTGYAAGVLGAIILAGIGLGMVIAPAINTGTFGVAPQDAGVASATVTVGQQLGASVGTSLLNTIFAAAVTSYLAAHLAAARLIGRPALTGLALGARLRHRVLVDRRHLRRRRGRRRRPAPLAGLWPGRARRPSPRPKRQPHKPRPAPPFQHDVAAQIRGVREGGGRRTRGVRLLSERPVVFRGPAAPWVRR